MKFKSDAQRKAVMSQYDSNRPTLSEGQIRNIKRDGVGKTKPKGNPALDPTFTKSTWSERTVNLAIRRINAGKLTPSEIFAQNKSLDSGDGVALSNEQQAKGLSYLRNQYQSPTGKERTNNPFGERESSVLTQSDAKITLQDFYSERGNFYVPMYSVTSSKAGGSFDYAVYGGKVHILG